MAKQKFIYSEIHTDHLSSTDLQDEAWMNPTVRAYHLFIGGKGNPAEVLVCPDVDRIGIAWGGDATWASFPAEDLEAAIDCYLSDAEEWEARN